MFGDSEFGIDKGKSTFEIDLSDTPKLDTRLKTTFGGMAWEFGPEQHGYVTVKAGATISFAPEIRLTLEPKAGTTKFRFSGEVQATILADFKATKSSKFEKVVKFSPQSVLGCAAVFCVNFMVQGVAKLSMKAELAGHASAEVKASYSVSGVVDFNSKTGEADAQIELGKLIHEETITYKNTFKGHIELKAGPVFTVLPLPGSPINFEPFAKIELKAYAQGGPTSLLEHNVTDSKDAIAFWQSKVKVAKEDDVDLIETQPSNGGSTQILNACGKAGLNIRAGAEINFLGFPFPDFDTADLKKQIMDKLAQVPTKSSAEVAKMMANCAGIPGVGSAVSGLDSVTKDAASFISDTIPDFKISFPEAKALIETPEACHSVWQHSVPKGQWCSGYNIGCGSEEIKASGYIAITKPSKWESAVEACENLGTSIATITSDAEQEKAWKVCEEAIAKGGNGCVIGLRKEGGKFVWKSDSDSTYSQWIPNEPKGDGNEVFMDKRYAGKWNDAKFDHPFYRHGSVLCGPTTKMKADFFVEATIQNADYKRYDIRSEADAQAQCLADSKCIGYWGGTSKKFAKLYKGSDIGKAGRTWKVGSLPNNRVTSVKMKVKAT